MAVETLWELSLKASVFMCSWVQSQVGFGDRIYLVKIAKLCRPAR